jgi:hypothetical protein
MTLDKHNVRALLLDLGVGDFNATMAIPYMFIAPRTTDPAAVQLLVVVRKLQEALLNMGATDVVPTGVLDDTTAKALAQICGPEWLSMPYYEIVRCVVKAEKAGHAFIQPSAYTGPGPEATEGWTDVFNIQPPILPAVPGGVITYGVAGYFLWKHFKKPRRNPSRRRR